MIAWIKEFLVNYGVGAQYLDLATLSIGFLIILLAALLSFIIVNRYVLTQVENLVKLSRNTLDDMILDHKVFSRLSSLVPLLVIWFLLPHLLLDNTITHTLTIVLVKIAITFQVARVLDALLNVIKAAYRQQARERYLPLNSAIQVIKLMIYLVASILAISYVLDKSPIYLLSGLGALTAVLLLVFQDTIKGFVASIQISVNRMVAPGDWIEIPQYGADGDVMEIGLTTVKVQNFDRTITTVPTYALISGSFRNWRGMYASGARRIKRCMTVDVASIRFYSAQDIQALSHVKLISGYLSGKQADIESFHQQHAIDSEDPLNSRQLTNIGTFRAYIEAYLRQHPDVNQEMTCMVRQLKATATGLPLELYFFSRVQDWVQYEGIQADIFDHLYAMAKIFDVRIFQHPSGEDWRQRS